VGEGSGERGVASLIEITIKAIPYLQKFVYTFEQAYILLSCAPVEGRISGVVDFPIACCIPVIEIFEKPILPV